MTGNLTELTGQVAPCDVSSVHAIRKAMGIAPPPEPLIDLTTGNPEQTQEFKRLIYQKSHLKLSFFLFFF